MILTLPQKEIAQESVFELCLSSPEYLSVILIQSSPVNYFPEKESILVTEQMNLTLNPKGKTLIEVDECEGKAITFLSSEFNNLNSISSEIKQNRRMNGLIEFDFYGPVFLSSKMKKGLLKWRDYDEVYDQFQTGWIRITKKQSTLVVSAEALKQLSSTTQIDKIIYKFGTGKEESDLSSTLNCGKK